MSCLHASLGGAAVAARPDIASPPHPPCRGHNSFFGRPPTLLSLKLLYLPLPHSSPSLSRLRKANGKLMCFRGSGFRRTFVSNCSKSDDALLYGNENEPEKVGPPFSKAELESQSQSVEPSNSVGNDDINTDDGGNSIEVVVVEQSSYVDDLDIARLDVNVTEKSMEYSGDPLNNALEDAGQLENTIVPSKGFVVEQSSSVNDLDIARLDVSVMEKSTEYSGNPLNGALEDANRLENTIVPSESLLNPSEVGSNEEIASKAGFPLRLVALGQIAWETLKSNPLFEWTTQWRSWQNKRKLEYLLAQADAHPMDASKQSALFVELNKHDPEAVIKRFEQREHATDGKAVVEYLRALIATNAIEEYLQDNQTGKPAGLPSLLQELKQRAAGNVEEPFASPGMSEKHPLHVVMVDAKGGKSMRFVQELVSTCLFMIFFGLMWVMFAAFLRKYMSNMGGMGTPPGISSSATYAPKEYNKENLPEKNTKTFKDVKGCDEAKAELEEIVEYLKNPAKFTRLGGKLPKGVLLTGPPGTGKTLLAKAVAGEAGVPFFYRAGSEFEEMFVGVGARRVRALFQAAKKKAPCILFIDEIDAVGSTRKQWEGHTKKTLHQLLVEMDGFEANEGIIVMAATNLPETLDPALTRPGRFDRHIVVTNPDVRGRQEILELYLQDKPLSEDVDMKSLARGTPGFNGADLANLVNTAALKAALDGTEKVSNSHLEFAKDKIIMGTERKSFVLSEESRKLTAYHESGHAVVAYNTAGAYPIHKATITPRGKSLGMVSQLPDKDETSVSKMQMLARLDVAMGGRVAEELIFGSDQVTSGARSDLQQATALARHMISECGMSDKVGPIFIGVDDQRPSQDIQRSIDAEVVKLLKEAYERVKTLLRKHEADLHALAKALLEHETLNAKEIKEVLGPLRDNVVTVEANNI